MKTIYFKVVNDLIRSEIGDDWLFPENEQDITNVDPAQLNEDLLGSVYDQSSPTNPVQYVSLTESHPESKQSHLDIYFNI